MAGWPRSRIPSDSSLSSLSSSSSSLPAPSLLDLADDLWFYRSVLPLPPLALPCFPPVVFSASPPVDTSTLLAECMRDRACVLPGPPPTDLNHAICDFYYVPASREDANRNDDQHVAHSHGYSSLSVSSDDDDGWYHSRSASVEDEEAFRYYSATSDWDDEDAYKGYFPMSDFEDELPLDSVKEEQAQSDPEDKHAYSEPYDAISGIYDVATLLKRQQYKEIEEVGEKNAMVPSSHAQHEPVKEVPAFPQIQALSSSDQADIKENLRLWAHAVALTLPWKAAARARPLL